MKIRRKAWKFTATCVVMMLLACGAMKLFDVKIGPTLRDAAAAEADVAVTRLINDKTAECLAGKEIVTTERDADGSIRAVRVDTEAMQRLKADVTQQILDALCDKNSDTAKISVPSGSLTGLDFLAGRGFSVNVPVASVQTARADFSSSIIQAGLNNALHRITMRISVEFVLLLPTETLRRSVTSDVVVSEVVIMGAVPFA